MQQTTNETAITNLWCTMADVDPFLTDDTEMRGIILATNTGAIYFECGITMPLSRVLARLDEYHDAE